MSFPVVEERKMATRSAQFNACADWNEAEAERARSNHRLALAVCNDTEAAYLLRRALRLDAQVEDLRYQANLAS